VEKQVAATGERLGVDGEEDAVEMPIGEAEADLRGGVEVGHDVLMHLSWQGEE